MYPKNQKILSEALEALRQGEPPGSVLSRYPEHADELRASLELVQQLRAAPLPPLPERWKAAEANFLRAAAMRRAALPASQPRRRSLLGQLLGPRLRVVLASLVLFLTLGAGTVAAAGDALPGSPLYSVKRASEWVELALTSQPRQALVLLQQGQERQHELRTLLQQDRAVPATLVADLAQQLQASGDLLAQQSASQLEAWQELESLSASSVEMLGQLHGKVDALSVEQASATLGQTWAQARVRLGRPKAQPPAEQGASPAPAATATPEQRTPPGQERTPPGQERTPPGQQQPAPSSTARPGVLPPGQERTPPGQERTPPGQERTPPGQEQPGPGVETKPPAPGQAKPKPTAEPPKRDNGEPGNGAQPKPQPKPKPQAKPKPQPKPQPQAKPKPQPKPPQGPPEDPGNNKNKGKKP